MIHQKRSYLSSDRDRTQYPYNAKPKTPEASKPKYAMSRTCGFAKSNAFAAGLCAAASALAQTIKIGVLGTYSGVLADLQLVQAKIGGLTTETDASALLVYHSGWTHDVLGRRESCRSRIPPKRRPRQEELCRVASDPPVAKQFLLKISMMEALRASERIQ